MRWIVLLCLALACAQPGSEDAGLDVFESDALLADGPLTDGPVNDETADAGTPAEPPRPPPVRWPTTFLGGTASGFLADNDHVAELYEASEFSFHQDPADSTRGVVTSHGVTVEGRAFERSYVTQYRRLGAPNFTIGQPLARQQLPDWARFPVREQRFDYCAETLSTCLAECDRDWCPAQCRATARRCMTVEDIVAQDGDATVVIHENAYETAAWHKDEPMRVVAEVRWGDARRRIFQDEVLGRALFESLEMSLVRLSPRRSAVYLHSARTEHNRVLVREDAKLHELGGGILHAYQQPLMRESFFGDRHRPWTWPPMDSSRIRFPGDNTLRRDFVETAYCGPSELDSSQSSYARHRRRSDQVVLRLNAASDTIQRVTRTRSRWGACYDEHIAACPFVDVVNGSETVRLGEILRNVRYEAETQSLTLPNNGGPMVVRISEEKREVTHLDEVHAWVGGVRFSPRVCQNEVPPSYCEADGHSTILETGDSLTLHFDLPPGKAELVATGYYVPF